VWKWSWPIGHNIPSLDRKARGNHEDRQHERYPRRDPSRMPQERNVERSISSSERTGARGKRCDAGDQLHAPATLPPSRLYALPEAHPTWNRISIPSSPTARALQMPWRVSLSSRDSIFCVLSVLTSCLSGVAQEGIQCSGLQPGVLVPSRLQEVIPGVRQNTGTRSKLEPALILSLTKIHPLTEVGDT
jgi:hypothetical protein